MDSVLNRHVVVLPFVSPSHATPLAKLVLKLAAAAPSVHFSFLGIIGCNDVFFGSDTRVNVKVYEVVTSPWANPLPNESTRGKVQRFLEGAPAIFETAIKVAEEDVGVRVSCLLTDAFLTFACKIAKKMEAKWVALWIGVPTVTSTYIHIDEIVQKFLYDEEESSQSNKTLEGIPGLSLMRIKDLPFVSSKTAMQDNTFILYHAFREMRSVLAQADATAINYYEEASSTALVIDLKSKLKEMLFLGSLTASFSQPTLDSRSDKTGCLAWLDEQKNQSVVYICFGSLVELPPEEMVMLAEALEACRIPYLWSLKDSLKLHLPPGFEERTLSHGKIVPWAPQNQILWHPAISTFITHCGCNSIFESVASEVPLICRPLWADNKINAQIIEKEWGIGVNIEEGTMTKDGMIKCLEMVMGDGEVGKEMRTKIKAFKQVLVNAAGPNGSASRDFNTLVNIISS